MKRSRTVIMVLAAACALLACGCRQGTTSISSFTKDDTVRLELDGQAVFVYNENSCQLSYNEKRCTFRAHTDTMLDYFTVQLDHIPSSTGEAVTADISWNTTYGEKNKNNITLNVQRIRGDVIWLCDASQHTAAVVRTLK